MSGSSRQGRWVASSVTEEDIAKLRAARYLTAETLHRLPAEGQVIPTPRSSEWVVFVSHFLQGLGFALNAFVRGLMFYYGLYFHDLTPNSVLLISAFIVTCEAFLQTPPHFGLWLKTFNVKPQMIEGEQAECGGASVSKLTNAVWLKGSSKESSDLWQQEWFYITGPVVPSGQLHLRSDPAPQFSLHHGLIRGWTGDQLTKCGLCKVASEASLRRISILSTLFR